MKVHLRSFALPPPYEHQSVRWPIACGQRAAVPSTVQVTDDLDAVTCFKCRRSLTYHCRAKINDQSSASLEIVGKVDPKTGHIVPFDRDDWERIKKPSSP